MVVRVETDERPLDTPSSEESRLGNSSDSSEQQSSTEEAALVVPPDGGWGWLVVAASFCCNVLVDGIIFSSGLFADCYMKQFNITDKEVNWVSSLFTGFYLLAGPFVGALANRYGFRAITIAGSIIGCTGLCLSTLATNVGTVYVTTGLIGGIGFCMMYLPSVIVVGLYFEKWRAVATGLALCGSGVGTLLFGPLTSTMLTECGNWKNTLLIQGGLMLICSLLALTFRPITPVTVTVTDAEVAEAETKKREEAVEKLNSILKLQSKLDSGLTLPHDLRPQAARAATPHTWMGVPSNTTYPTAADVFRNSGTGLNRRASANTAAIKSQLRAPRYTVVPVPENDEDADSPVGDSAENEEPLLQKLDHVEIRPRLPTKRPSAEPVSRPFYRDDIFFSGSLARLSQYKSHTSLGYHMAVTHVPTATDVKEERQPRCSLCPEAVKRALATMLDVGLFRSPCFVILAVSGLLTMLGFLVPYAMVSRRALKIFEWDNDVAKWLMSAIGGANVVGRILCGVLSNSDKVSTLWLNNIAITLGGIATLLSGLCGEPAFQFIYCIIFGFATACFASLRSILVVEYLGLERLTNAFGLLLLFQGVGALVGTPVAGNLLEATGSFDPGFYFSGGCLLLSAIVCYPLEYVRRWEKERDNKKPAKV